MLIICSEFEDSIKNSTYTIYGMFSSSMYNKIFANVTRISETVSFHYVTWVLLLLFYSTHLYCHYSFFVCFLVVSCDSCGSSIWCITVTVNPLPHLVCVSMCVFVCDIYKSRAIRSITFIYANASMARMNVVENGMGKGSKEQTKGLCVKYHKAFHRI